LLKQLTLILEVIMHRRIVLRVIRDVILAAIGTGFLLVQGCGEKYPYEEVLKRNSEQMNRKCPIDVGEGTRLDSTSAGPGRRFTYYYTLTRQVQDSIDVKSMNEKLRPQLIGNIKTNQSLVILRKNKADMVYDFFDRKGRFILSIPITPKEYGR
jgi:hypothetical protein